MANFLDYGEPTGTHRTPLTVNTDPRGVSSDQFYRLMREEQIRKDANEEYWAGMADENGFGKMDYLGRSVVQESMVNSLVGWAEDYVADYDPTFDPTPYIKEDWPAWRKEAMMEAKNPRHAQVLLERTEEQDLYNKEGEYLGGWAMPLQVFGGLLQPENLLLGAGEAALLGKLGLAGVAKVAAGAASGAVVNTAQEAIIMANNKSRDKFGLFMAAGFGAAFGAAGSVFSPGRAAEINAIDQSAAKNFSGYIANDVAIATGDLPKVRPQHISPDAKIWQDAVQMGEAAIDENGRYVVVNGDQFLTYSTKQEAIRAKRLLKKGEEVTPENLAKEAELTFEEEAAAYDAAIPKRKGGKWSSIGLEGRSHENAFIRKLFSMITEDSSGTGGKNVATHSAALNMDLYAHQLRSEWHVPRFQKFKEWAKDTGNKTWKPWDRRPMDLFDREVLKEIGFRKNPESRPSGVTPHKAISEAADAYENFRALEYKRKVDSGVDGYVEKDFDKHYIKHKWDGIKMTALQTKYGREAVVTLLKKAILAGGEFDRKWKYGKLGEKLTDEFKDRTAGHMANAIFDRFIRRPDTRNIARTGWVSKKELTDMKERLYRIVDNPEDIKHILAAVDGKDSRVVNEVLSQIELDTNLRHGEMSVLDLMDTNLGASLDTDIRRSAGRAAMADIGFGTQDEFLEFVEKATRWSRENLGYSEIELARDHDKMMKLWNMLMGENLEVGADRTSANFFRGLRKLATLNSLNQVGYAQVAETGRLIGGIGMKQFISAIPEMKNMIRSMKTGKFKSPLLNDIENALGVRLGDNEALHNPVLLTESGGFGISKSDQDGFLAGADHVMNKGLHLQGYLNGMNYVMKAQHRMHARGFFMRLFEDINKTDIPTRRIRRYADMGLSIDDLRKVKSEMNKNVEMGQGWFGQPRPVNFHLTNIDPVIRQKLLLSFWKNQSQVVQRSLGGETAWWMENTFGKLLAQFRSFPLVAIEKQTLHDLKFLDIEAFTTATFSLGIAALAYSAKTYGNSFGLPPKKRKQYLKNRLSPGKLFAGAASWTGQAAVFPDVMRTAGDFGFDTPFAWTYQKGQAYRDNYREKSLGLSAAGAAGSLVENAYKFATGLGQAALTPADLKASTFKYALGFVPYGNNQAIKIAGNFLLE